MVINPGDKMTVSVNQSIAADAETEFNSYRDRHDELVRELLHWAGNAAIIPGSLT